MTRRPSAKRPLRALQLAEKSPPVLPPGSPQDGWSRVRQIAGGTEHRWRKGNRLHIRQVTQRRGNGEITSRRTHTVRPALVSYKKLLRTVRVVDDDDAEPPWENCDGFEHRLVTYREWLDFKNDGNLNEEMFRNCHKYIYYDCDRCWIELQCDMEDPWGLYTDQRAHGASKQVAREYVAAKLRQTVSLLYEWRHEGWQAYGVRVGPAEYEESCWGYDDAAYARYEGRTSLLSQVVHRMEQDGFSVYGAPSAAKRYRVGQAYYTVDEFRRRLRHNPHRQNPDYKGQVDYDKLPA